MLTFSSSFVFDNNFETGITMSQSSRQIRTEAKTWTGQTQSIEKSSLTIQSKNAFIEKNRQVVVSSTNSGKKLTV